MGDLPDADVAPPDNVLFVCKLNPITQDEDLELIFSRFGKVKKYAPLFCLVFSLVLVPAFVSCDCCSQRVLAGGWVSQGMNRIIDDFSVVVVVGRR